MTVSYKKTKVTAKRLPKGFISLAEQQERRLSGIEINKTALDFLNSSYNISDLFDVGCIYYLFFEGEIVYIGQTKNILERIAKHYRSRKMIFDKFRIQEFRGSDKQRLAREAFLIRNHKPKYNETLKVRKKKDALECRTVTMNDCKV